MLVTYRGLCSAKKPPPSALFPVYVMSSASPSLLGLTECLQICSNLLLLDLMLFLFLLLFGEVIMEAMMRVLGQCAIVHIV